MGGYGCFFDPAGVYPGCVAYDYCEMLAADHWPMPGDVVILSGEYSLCKPGDMAVIEGWIGVPQEEYLVCFRCNGQAFRGRTSFIGMLESQITTGITGPGGVVSCSGGPALYIKGRNLVMLPYEHEQLFWKWKDLPRADGGEDYRLKVQAWAWEGCHG